jgi:hypothetical protein
MSICSTFVRELSAVIKGALKYDAEAAIIASGSFSLCFLLISTVKSLISWFRFITLHSYSKDLIIFIWDFVSFGNVSNSNSVTNEMTISLPSRMVATSLLPFSK